MKPTAPTEDQINRTHRWASSRGIHGNSNSMAQALKTHEEVGELILAIYNGDKEKTKDAVGDILVTLINATHFEYLTLHECLEHSINIIEKRSGEMVNGQFVKNE